MSLSMNPVMSESVQFTHDFMVGNMRPSARIAIGAFLAASLNGSAIGQTTSPLAYIQPVPPAAVQAVQEHLRSAGAYSGAADGVLGPDSVAALQRFQAGHQLQVTGQLNQATAAALGLDPAALLGPQQAALPPPVPLAETLRQSSVRTIQERLRNLGFYRGAVDGVWGQTTQRAIEQFQQNRGLQPNGQLTPATVTAMGLAPDSLTYR
jgi:peptidoglycan hydrolase-like protein with peptidoglycan-binding domain